MALTKIQSLGITDGTIVNADINASAAIAGTKLSGAGKVLQVVQGTSMVRTTTTSTTFVNTNVTVNITPSSASNKILITGHTQLYSPNISTTYGPGVAIKRNSTEVWKSSASGSNYFSFFGSNANTLLIPVPFGYLDSPSLTSSITYTLAISSFTGTSVEDFAGDLGARYTGVIIAMEIAG